MMMMHCTFDLTSIAAKLLAAEVLYIHILPAKAKCLKFVNLKGYLSSLEIIQLSEHQWCADTIVIAQSILLLLRNESHF